ncbi:MAG: NTP transferase domain-containing protein [Vicinamibacterales bacterium]
MSPHELGPAATLIVLQARLGSRRLPGKALSRIGGRTILAHAVTRLVASGVAPVVVATTTETEDDAIAMEAARLGVAAFRGPRDHVLERFVLLARLRGARRLVRATADNPAVDIDAPGRVLAALEAQRADYVVEDGLPYGGAVEAVTVGALEQALAWTRDPYDQEHVTPYVVRRPDVYRVVRAAAPASVRRPDLRFTVDTREDLLYMREVFSVAGPHATGHPMAGLIRAADRLRGLALQGAA